MPKLTLQFGNGIQKPAKLGTVILKPTAGNNLAYAQNIHTSGLEYGENVMVPGPNKTTFTNNSELTGIPIAKSYFANSAEGYITFIEGVLGSTDEIRRIKDVLPGSTPVVDTAAASKQTVGHSGHTNLTLTDLTRTGHASVDDDMYYVAGYDDTDRFVKRFNNTVSTDRETIVITGDGTDLDKVFRASDNNVYVSRYNLIDQIIPASSLGGGSTHTASAFTMPTSYKVSEFGEWNNLLAIAYSSFNIGDISQRKGGGKSGILLWDLVATANYVRDIQCPSSFITAIVNKPDGNIIAFGALDAGVTVIYLFNGYGFSELYSYIGEPPRNRHSVDFDNQGRLVWQTIDGQVCMYDFLTGNFQHIASVDASSGHGGIFGRLLGGTGSEFIVASGKTGNTFDVGKLSYGSYIGDADSATDDYNTPLAITGMQFLPHSSIITSITLYATKPLATGEKVILYLYKNGNTTSTNYLTFEFATDGAVSSKRVVKSVTKVDNFSLGVVYKQADGLATAVPVFTALVEYEPTIK